MPVALACPSCGIAVTPGYVRCPKCHAELPRRRMRTQVGPGGTAVPSGPRPIVPIAIAVAVVAGAIIAFVVAGRRRGEATAAPEEPAAPSAVTSAAPPSATPQPTFAETAAPSAPSADAIASGLDRALKRERLWSTVIVVGDRLDIRSSSCTDRGLAQIVNDARAQLAAAGVRSVRCAEVNGRIVFDRGL